MLKKVKNNKVFKISSTIIKAFFSLAIILVVLVIFVQRVSNNSATLGGYSVFTIISASMTPEYKIGDMVFAKTKKAEDIEIGDDVVYLGKKGDFADKIVTHRVIGKTNVDGKYIFETKGIANELPDPKIDETQIKGVVIFKGVLISTISKLVNNTYGFYFLLFIPLSILIFFEVLDISAERKKLNKNE